MGSEIKAKAKANKVAFRKKRKQDALDFALLIYDVYKEKVIYGQNNANHTKT